MQAVGLEPTRANTLRPERSTLDHSVTLAPVRAYQTAYLHITSCFLPALPFYPPLSPSFLNKQFKQYVYDIGMLL